MNDETPSTSLKISMGSVTSNPIPDKTLFNDENKKIYKIIIILIVIDFVINELVYLHDYILKQILGLERKEEQEQEKGKGKEEEKENEKKEPELFLFFLFTTISLIFFGTILFVLYLKKLILSKIARFSYLILGILYYAYQVVSKLMYFSIDGFSLSIFDIFFFLIISISIVPRIVGFLYIKVNERSIIKLDKAKLAEEHVMFIEKVSSNLDRSTTNNLKEHEFEKELDQTVEEEEEEVIFKMNKENKVVTSDKNIKNKNNRRKSKEEDEEKEEVADLS